MNFEHWPFDSPESHLPEQAERWWEECYLAPPAQMLAGEYSQGCVLWGRYQSGRSTLIKALKRAHQSRFLTLEDDFFNQPNPAPLPGNVLFRLMMQATWAIRQRLAEQPERLAQIRSQTSLEFIRWGIEKFHGRRAFLRWLDILPDEAASLFQEMPFEDFYPTQTQAAHVQGQIEELLTLSRKLGYEGVLYLVDLLPFPTSQQVEELRALLGWREPMQHNGLKFLIAVPPVLSRQETRELLRDRLPLLEIAPPPEFVQEVVKRYLTVATDGQIQTLEQCCSPGLLKRLQNMLEEEFGIPPLGAWLKVASLALEIAPEPDVLLQEDAFSRLQQLYAVRFCPLHPDPDVTKIGIWRGYRWIELDRSQYEFLELVARAKQPVDHLVAQTTKSNLHTLASRLRKKIELIEEQPENIQSEGKKSKKREKADSASEHIYLKNTKGEGYVLENYRAYFP